MEHGDATFLRWSDELMTLDGWDDGFACGQRGVSALWRSSGLALGGWLAGFRVPGLALRSWEVVYVDFGICLWTSLSGSVSWLGFGFWRCLS